MCPSSLCKVFIKMLIRLGAAAAKHKPGWVGGCLLRQDTNTIDGRQDAAQRGNVR